MFFTSWRWKDINVIKLLTWFCGSHLIYGVILIKKRRKKNYCLFLSNNALGRVEKERGLYRRIHALWAEGHRNPTEMGSATLRVLLKNEVVNRIDRRPYMNVIFSVVCSGRGWGVDCHEYCNVYHTGTFPLWALDWKGNLRQIKDHAPALAQSL